MCLAAHRYGRTWRGGRASASITDPHPRPPAMTRELEKECGEKNTGSATPFGPKGPPSPVLGVRRLGFRGGDGEIISRHGTAGAYIKAHLLLLLLLSFGGRKERGEESRLWGRGYISFTGAVMIMAEEIVKRLVYGDNLTYRD